LTDILDILHADYIFVFVDLTDVHIT
jgi:hypothetical protein